MVTSATPPAATEATAWAALRAVPDPEIPVLSVVDLGLIRHVTLTATGILEVGLAPTYTGCPAMAVIRASIDAALRGAGFAQPRIVEILSPAWSSDWLTAAGRQKLKDYGIAPPTEVVNSPRGIWRDDPAVHCPRCESVETEELSRFGSTPCKALYRCRNCLEPFEYFKCI